MGRDVLALLPEREAAGGGQGLVHRAARPHRGHRAARADVAADEAHRDRRSSRRSSATSPRRSARSFDALAVYVHQDNPLEKLTLAQADADLLQDAQARGAPRTSPPGATSASPASGRTRPISLYGRNSASGTYGFFKEHVLQNGDYKDTVKEQPGSASVVQGVTNDRYGDGLQRHRLPDLRREASCPSPRTDGGAFSTGSYEDVVSGKYPLARFLYLYVNKAPGKPLDPLVREFLKLVLSQRRAGGRGQGRLPAPHAGDRDGGAAQARIAAGHRHAETPSPASKVRQRIQAASGSIRTLKRIDRAGRRPHPPGRARDRRQRARHPGLHRGRGLAAVPRAAGTARRHGRAGRAARRVRRAGRRAVGRAGAPAAGAGRGRRAGPGAVPRRPRVLAMGVDEYQMYLYAVRSDAARRVLPARRRRLDRELPAGRLGGARA